MSEVVSDFDFLEGTEGTEGTPANGAAFRGSPGENHGEPEGTFSPDSGEIDPVSTAIDPMEEPTGAEHDKKLNFPPIAERPCYACYWDWCGPVKKGQRTRRPGVYYHTFKEGNDKQPPALFDDLVCSPLAIKALTCTDDANQLYGLLLEFRDPDGKTRKWAMPRNLLGGSCEELRKELLDQGVEIKDRAKLPDYLQWRTPKARIISATSTGWADSGKAFVLPNRVIGSDTVIFQSEKASHEHMPSIGGKFETWKTDVAAPCVGNPVLALSICAALTGPLLERLHRQSTGLHWYDDSSTGKTTACMVGASIWGGKDFVRTWRATANGIEGAAAAVNDTLLCLDEINEADPKQVGEIVYAVANGVGKTRANRIGAARKVQRWRVVVLSTGERTLRQQMLEGGKQMKVGQEVRLLNVPSKRTHGAFDCLHQFPDGRSLADHLKTACSRHHGHAGPLFVEKLIEYQGDLGADLDRLMKLTQFDHPDSQAGRAAGFFALFGLAGELATDWGILPWAEGTALAAAADGYQRWLSARGKGMTEQRQILQSICDFIAKHADSRFSKKGHDAPIVVHNRAGYWTETPEGERVYLFNAPGLREAATGYDFKRTLDALDAAGWIHDRDNGKRSKKTHIDTGMKPALYWVKPGEVSE